ncbi:Imm47 family immunity protein [Pseudoduganella sp. SL102]|uniref:Imm47 family immunity protein n=1 Tax=Pseudoduganella sp. SL102 TaxID=2995154 RepID=UPI00248BD052|nr:Imm47 family immunity protein [Pseudoduganella sp. SL102]WBS04790.1 Imm47 family immunity protein [Pseudoduganella sp. SL102]
MKEFDILHPGPWFGPKTDSMDLIEKRSNEDAKTKLLELCSRLKYGDFSARSSLEGFILTCSEPAIRRQAIRLYCYIARHEDVDFLGNLLARGDHDEVFSVALYAPHTLSLQIVPYLFALLEEYDGTSIEETVLTSIGKILPLKSDSENADINELSASFTEFAKKCELKKYYYSGIEAFAGTLTRTLIEATAIARQKKTSFPLADIPTLLSMWSGVQCPVFYDDLISDEKFEEVMSFVSQISSMQWAHGEKYFYGYRIT